MGHGVKAPHTLAPDGAKCYLYLSDTSVEKRVYYITEDKAVWDPEQS
jgi:hypothetical protein